MPTNMEEIEEIKRQLQKDEHGLYIHASNYLECKLAIEATITQ